MTYPQEEYAVGPEEEALELLLDEESNIVNTIMKDSSYKDSYYDTWKDDCISLRGERIA